MVPAANDKTPHRAAQYAHRHTLFCVIYFIHNYAGPFVKIMCKIIYTITVTVKHFVTTLL